MNSGLQKLRVALTTVAFIVIIGMIGTAAGELAARPRMTEGTAVATKYPSAAGPASMPSAPTGLYGAVPPGARVAPPTGTTPVAMPRAAKPPRSATGVAEGSAAGATGGHDRDTVNLVIRGASARTRQCYERSLVTNPGLAGRITVAWSIQPDGTVANARIEQSDMMDGDFVNCLLRQVSALRFPTAAEPTNISFPFVFAPAN